MQNASQQIELTSEKSKSFSLCLSLSCPSRSFFFLRSAHLRHGLAILPRKGRETARNFSAMARGKAGFIKPMFERAKWKVLRGDTVAVTAGRDAGATGTVLKVIRDEKRPAVLVEGCNLVRAEVEGGREGRKERGRRD